MAKLWLTASELALLPGLPKRPHAVLRQAYRRRWHELRDVFGHPMVIRGADGAAYYSILLLPDEAFAEAIGGEIASR